MRLKGIALACVLWALPASATTMIALDVPTLSRQASLIVTGRVTRVESRMTADQSRIVTDIDIEVAETLKGEFRKTLTLVQTGGTVGDRSQKMHGLATFTQGEEVLLFLEPRGSQRFATVGMAQGKFLIQRASDGQDTVRADPEAQGALIDAVTGQRVNAKTAPWPLSELKRQVRQALSDAAINPGGDKRPSVGPAGPTRPTPSEKKP